MARAAGCGQPPAVWRGGPSGWHTGAVCTVICLFRPGHAWPLLLAANRDEMLDRPWRPPAAHWPGQPDAVGGLDALAGGTWLAVNRACVVAAVLNRTNTLGPAPGRRSRGELPLMALRHGSAMQAASAIGQLDASLWRSFNMVVADARGAFFLRGLESGLVESRALAPGLHMITATDPDDLSHPRVARHLPRFLQAAAPEPPDWGAWPELLASSDGPLAEALAIPPTDGFGTASGTLIGLAGDVGRSFLFTPARPGTVPYEPIAWP